MVAICRASKYIKVFHGIKHYDYGSTATTKRHSYSVRFFFVRRPEEYEGTLIVLTARIEESYTQEINLEATYISYLASWTSYNVTARELFREEYGLVWGVGSPGYYNDNKERRSWKTTVSTCPRTVGNFTRKRGVPTSPWHRSSFKMPSNWCK